MPDAVTQTTLQSAPVPALRPWSTPRLRELPKLTALTLASAIGGGGGTGGGGSTVFGLLLAVGLALGAGACAPGQEAGPSAVVPPVASQLVTCTVHRDAASLTCEAPSATAGPGVVGKQGVTIGLRSSGVSYSSGTDILSATVTVQNLSAQVMGALDGGTLSSGINVFFLAGPVGPLGETIGLNADGTNTFTAPNQEYFNYPEVLPPQGTTTGKVWEFDMNGTASFTFSVLVSADMPAPGAFMNWAQEPIVGVQPWRQVTGWGANGLALFGDKGLVSINDGTGWQSRNDPMGTDPSPYKPTIGVANGPNEIYRVGDDGTYIRYYDGISWRTITFLPGAPPNFNYGIASPVAGKLYVGSDNVSLFTKGSQEGGGVWSTLPDPTGVGDPCRAISATNGRVYCAFAGGDVYSWNGVSWTSSGSSAIPSPATITASDTNDIWVFGNNTLKHYSGGVWTSPATPGPLTDWNLWGGSSLSEGTTYLRVSRGFPSATAIWRWDGATLNADTLTLGLGPLSVWARNTDTAYAAGGSSVVWQRKAGSWDALAGNFGPGAGIFWKSAYIASASDIFLGAGGHKVRHWNGQVWLDQQTSTINNITALWGTGATNVYAVGGDYFFEHFDGTAWTTVDGFPFGVGTYGIWGTSASDVWAVGFDGTGGFASNILHFNGTSWSASTSPDDNASLNAVWAKNASLAVAVGDGGVIYRWNGSAWSAAASGTGNKLRAVWGSSASDIWAVGDGGVIRHWDGAFWSNGGGSCDGSNALTGVWGHSSTEVYVTSEGGRICFYDGLGWAPISGVASDPLYAIAASPDRSLGFAVGGQVYRATR